MVPGPKIGRSMVDQCPVVVMGVSIVMGYHGDNPNSWIYMGKSIYLKWMITRGSPILRNLHQSSDRWYFLCPINQAIDGMDGS